MVSSSGADRIATVGGSYRTSRDSGFERRLDSVLMFMRPWSRLSRRANDIVNIA